MTKETAVPPMTPAVAAAVDAIQQEADDKKTLELERALLVETTKGPADTAPPASVEQTA